MAFRALKCYGYFKDLLKEMVLHIPLSLSIIYKLGGRKSGKSWATQSFDVTAIDLVDACGRDVKVACYALRNLATKARGELFKEIQQTLDRNAIIYKRNKQEGTFTLNNGNFIQVLGLHTDDEKSSHVGLARMEGADYIIVYVEEAYECSLKEVQAFGEAVRGGRDTEILFIYDSNPWDPYSELIKTCVSYMKHDNYKLQTFGQQIGLFDDVLYNEVAKSKGSKIRKKILVHYTNWRVADAEGVLSIDDIVSIKRARENLKHDPQRLLITDLGLPTKNEKSIYGPYMVNLGNALWNKRHALYQGGCDVGLGTASNSGITAFTFIGLTPGMDCDVYGEYAHDNKKLYLKPRQIAINAIAFYKSMKERLLANGINIGLLDVKVDYSDDSFIDVLNTTTREAHEDYWLRFSKCVKIPIIQRVTAMRYMMTQGMIRFDRANCKGILKELSLSEWDDKRVNKENAKRKDANDHYINALEYAFHNYLKYMAKK